MIATLPRTFDEYRAAYRGMTYAEVVAYHDEIWRQYPTQVSVDSEAARDFFDGIPVRRVLEIGGWTGVTAAMLLPNLPDCREWLNVEICRGAAEHPATSHPAYRAIILPNWIWKQPTSFFRRFDTCFASHVLEHMRADQVEALIAKLGRVQHLYIDAPLPEGDPDWAGYGGAHVLEHGWAWLLKLLRDHGWTVRAARFNNPAQSGACMLERA